MVTVEQQQFVCAGRVLGPFDHSSLPVVHINRLGAVPKSTLWKYRMIVDLSYPVGWSVNDGIKENLCSLSYVSVELAAQTVLKLGWGALLAKVISGTHRETFLYTPMIGC